MAGGSRENSYADYLAKIMQYKAKNASMYGGSQPYGTKYGEEGQNIVRGIFGGPVGWGEIAAGKGYLGQGNDIFAGSTLNDAMTSDVYDSMTDDEWNAFAHMTGSEQLQWIQKRQAELKDPNSPANQQKAAAAKAKGEEDARQAAYDKRVSEQDSLIAKVKAFADEMNMPIDQLMQKDEFAKALNANTYQNSMGAGLNTGAGAGGLSQLNADMATKRALLGYQFQRQQAGQQALGNAYGMLANQNATAEDIARYNQGMNLQMQSLQNQSQQANYQQHLQQSGGLLGAIGGTIGSIYGGPAGGQAGYSLGSSLGQQNYMSQNPWHAPQYTYPSTGRNYGGNY